MSGLGEDKSEPIPPLNNVCFRRRVDDHGRDAVQSKMLGDSEPSTTFYEQKSPVFSKHYDHALLYA